MRKALITSLLLVGILFSSGCVHVSYDVWGEPSFSKTQIKTQRKYRILEHTLIVEDWKSRDGYIDITNKLKVFQPDVFDENGMEVVIRTDATYRRHYLTDSSDAVILLCLSLNTCFVLPVIDQFEHNYSSQIAVGEAPIVTHLYKTEVASTFPWPYLFSYSGETETYSARGKNWVTSSHRCTNSKGRDPSVIDPGIIIPEGEKSAFDEIRAYQIAAKIREIELRYYNVSQKLLSREQYEKYLADKHEKERRLQRMRENAVKNPSGASQPTMVVTQPVSVVTQQVSVVTQPVQVQKRYEYKILRLEKTATNDFEYEFEIEFPGGADLDSFRRISHDLRNTTAEQYAEEHQTNVMNVRVSYTTQKIHDGNIVSGRVGVYEFEGISMSYDSNSRRGTFAVKVVAGDFEATRRWVKKNIESIVADKNIMLKTGERPPQAHYKLLNEEVKDGVIVVEFEAE